MIEIANLTKRYGKLEALKGISLEVRPGEFFGLLGPNGAGKTTLIKAIVGLVRCDGGSVRVGGSEVWREPHRTKELIGYSPQEPNIDRYFPVRKTLELQGGYFGLSRSDRRLRARELMDLFGILDKSEDEFWKLSGGQQKRLVIARALMSRPKVLILDEPTAGVDVAKRHEIWKYLRRLNREGMTLLLTTHAIDEAQALCHRVAVIHAGNLIALGSPEELIDRYGGASRVVTSRGNLEDVFLKLTGRSIDEDEADRSISHAG